jgi:predicted nucleic acid-binding protein
MPATTFQILIDANVFIYAVGREHRLRDPSRNVLRLAAEYRDFFTSAEVFQEVLHRYLSLRMWAAMRLQFAGLMQTMVGRIEPLLETDIRRAAALADLNPGLSSRDLVHAAVMDRVGARRIVSADRGFDSVPDIERLDPMEVERWRHDVLGPGGRR